MCLTKQTPPQSQPGRTNLNLTMQKLRAHRLLRQVTQFRRDPVLSQRIIDWQKGRVDTLLDAKARPLKGTFLDGPERGKPIFQTLVEQDNFPFKLQEQSNYISFIPSTWPLATTSDPSCPETQGTPVPTKPPSDKTERTRQAPQFSLMHLLVIPKQRFFNFVSLDGSLGQTETRMLHEMRTLGRSSMEQALVAGPETPGSLAWRLANATEEDLRVTDFQFPLETWPLLKDGPVLADQAVSPTLVSSALTQLRFVFHLWPRCSVAWLHMHVFVDGWKTLQYERVEQASAEQDYLTAIDVEEALWWLKAQRAGFSHSFPLTDP